MKVFNLDEFTRGWFIGDFDPSLIRTQQVEVAIQKFSKGTLEAEHFHRLATEITVLVSGRAVMFGRVINEGEVVMISPGESTSFEALEDCVTAVVKMPGAKNDKYLME